MISLVDLSEMIGHPGTRTRTLELRIEVTIWCVCYIRVDYSSL